MSDFDKPKPTNVPDFDFKEWVELKDDPEAFEKKRAEWIEAHIQSAPLAHQQRLRGLQFEIEGIRKKAKNPYQSTINISKLYCGSITFIISSKINRTRKCVI